MSAIFLTPFDLLVSGHPEERRGSIACACDCDYAERAHTLPTAPFARNIAYCNRMVPMPPATPYRDSWEELVQQHYHEQQQQRYRQALYEESIRRKLIQQKLRREYLLRKKREEERMRAQALNELFQNLFQEAFLNQPDVTHADSTEENACCSQSTLNATAPAMSDKPTGSVKIKVSNPEFKSNQSVSSTNANPEAVPDSTSTETAKREAAYQTVHKSVARKKNIKKAKMIRKKLSDIRAIESEFEHLAHPEHISETLSQPLSFTSDFAHVSLQSRTYLELREGLNKLLSRLDSITSEGEDVVRESRKSTIGKIVKQLDALEQYEFSERERQSETSSHPIEKEEETDSKPANPFEDMLHLEELELYDGISEMFQEKSHNTVSSVFLKDTSKSDSEANDWEIIFDETSKST
jgi:hypothetical protein